MLPFPKPMRCAAALRLCCCSFVVAEPDAKDPAVLAVSDDVAGSIAEGDNAKVVDVDVDVVGCATTPVGVTGDAVTVAVAGGAAASVGEGTFPGATPKTLLALPAEP
jgi:hypothetical protein